MNYQEFDFTDIVVNKIGEYPYDIVGRNRIIELDVQGYRFANWVLLNNTGTLATIFPTQKEQLISTGTFESYPINYFQLYDYRDPGLSINKLGAPFRYREGAVNPQTLGLSNGTNGNISIQSYVLDGISTFSWIAGYLATSTVNKIDRIYCLLKSRYTGTTARINISTTNPTNFVWIDCRAHHWAGLHLFFNGTITTVAIDGYVYKTQPLAVAIAGTSGGVNTSNPMAYLQEIVLPAQGIAYRVNCQAFGWLRVSWTGAATTMTVKGLLQG
ncbi:MAG: hypothetical protein ACRC62_15325 [Microcoleus sp.]